MKALTLHRPWPWAILHAGKRLENRTWEPNLRVGEIFAIHAGAKYDAAAALWMQEHLHLSPPTPDADPIGIVGLSMFEDIVMQSSDRWFFGPLAWKLSNVWSVEPIVMPGAQRLWTVPQDVVSKLLAQINNVSFVNLEGKT